MRQQGSSQVTEMIHMRQQGFIDTHEVTKIYRWQIKIMRDSKDFFSNFDEFISKLNKSYPTISKKILYFSLVKINKEQ